MKKFFTVTAFLTVVALMITACPDGNNNKEKDDPYNWKVTFNTDGGAPDIPSIKVDKEDPYMGDQMPADPSKAGFEFIGWYRTDDAEYFQRYYPYSEITADTDLKARWRPNGFDISFDYTGGVMAPGSDSRRRVLEGEAIGELPAAPSREGYTFAGWFRRVSGGEGGIEEIVVDASFVPTANITLYAGWEFDGLLIPFPVFTVSDAHGGGFGGGYDEETKAWTITGSGGAIRWTFPDIPGKSIDDFDYFELRYTVARGSGNQTQTSVRQYGGSGGVSVYENGGNGNLWPWLANSSYWKIYIADLSGDTRGFAIQVNPPCDFDVIFTEMTFFTLDRLTVTFDLGYDGASGAPAPIDNIKSGFNIGADFPADPERTHADPGKEWVFIGWANDEGALVSASTPITGDWTLTAQWTDEASDGWIEFIEVLGGVTAPLYGFVIPEGGKLGDYTKITAKMKNPSASGRFRVWGTFPSAIWTPAVVPGVSGANIQNAAEGLLLVTGSADSIAADSSDEWMSYNLIFNKAATYNTSPVSTGAWDDNATGTILFAVGFIGDAGNNSGRSYYLKDIALSNADGTKTIPALDPQDEKLWDGAGAGAYAQASGASNGLTRRILPYEDE